MTMRAYDKAKQAGLLLSGTKYDGSSGKQLRERNPKLALKWVEFIRANKAQLVKEIAGLV